MGGVDGTEPPSKRVKGYPIELGSLSNNSSLQPLILPLGGPMARPLLTQGKDDMIGSKGVIKRVEFVRIIIKTLYSLGYEKSGKALEEESGLYLHSSHVSLFRKHVLDGNWDGGLATLQKIGLDDHILNSAAFLILEYKFLDLLEKDRVMDALNTLRREIAPLNTNKKRLHELSCCIILSSQRGLRGSVSLSFDTGKLPSKLLDELQKLIPPAVMVPERRLETLVEQALSFQRESCFFHNSLDNALSLFTDHQCGKDQLPSKTLQAILIIGQLCEKWEEIMNRYINFKILQGHDDEIWFLQFSNDGKYLASSSNNGSVIIWEVHEDGKVSLKCTLKGHQKPVVMVAWSPDDRYLLSCGIEEVARFWDVNSGECLRVFEKNGLGLLSCVWSPDGKYFFSGLTDGSISLCDLEGNEVENWKGHRTTKSLDMAVAKDGKQIISMCGETAILMLDTESKFEKLIEEDQTIISFSLSRDEKFLLVNLLNEEIHLWSIVDIPKLLTRYKGHKHSRFVIRSCFGGFGQGFIASGSENSQVYIWHRKTGELIQELPGHSGAVNCVSWNPANPHMLASGSDDHTIRIWGLNSVNLKRKDSLSNGFIIHCNGTSK